MIELRCGPGFIFPIREKCTHEIMGGSPSANAPVYILLPHFSGIALCPVLMSPANGVVMITGQTSGSTAAYTCNSGFELLDDTSGSNVRTCEDGTWSGSEAQCIGIILLTMHDLTSL